MYSLLACPVSSRQTKVVSYGHPVVHQHSEHPSLEATPFSAREEGSGYARTILSMDCIDRSGLRMYLLIVLGLYWNAGRVNRTRQIHNIVGQA